MEYNINKTNLYNNFLELTNIFPDSVKGLYITGSHQYGCNREDSDIDLTAIVNEYPSCGEQFISDKLNVNFYKVSSIHRLLFTEAYIPLIEAFYADEKDIIISFFIDTIPIKDLLDDVSQLRVSCSQLTSNSWVKGQKKLVTSDYDLNMGLKSIFHSIRIQDFVIQLLDGTTTPNYGSCNYILYDLFSMSEKLYREELWDAIKSKYYAIYKDKKSRIKSLIPKEGLNSHKRKSELLEILKKHGVTVSSSLVEDLLNFN